MRDVRCCVLLGGAGNYVKMIHNGIEYGDMQVLCPARGCRSRACQRFSPRSLLLANRVTLCHSQLIAETYDVLKNVGHLSNAELADVFAKWNTGVLDSFLIEITSIILRHKEADGSYTVDSVRVIARDRIISF